MSTFLRGSDQKTTSRGPELHPLVWKDGVVLYRRTLCASLVCLMVLAWACAAGDGGLPTPTRPSTVPSPVPAPPQSQRPLVISVGEEVKGTLSFHGDERLFELTARSDGTLVARVSWEPSRGRLELMLADRWFGPSQPEGSPIVGTLPVVAGQTYRVRIADGAPWDYDDLLVPFVLTTSIR